MKKSLLFLSITILSLNCYSQISFKRGYFIDNNDKRIDCLIKDTDKKNNPTKFVYKLSENGELKERSIESTKEYGVSNVFKYLRKTVDIDKSSDNLNKLSLHRHPIFVEEQLFLNVLVEGKANLYLYENGLSKRFFYSKENSAIKQLIYKKFLGKRKNPYNSHSHKQIGENFSYKNLLWKEFKTPALTLKEVENMNYEKDDLVNLFINYNEQGSQNFTSYEEKEKKDLFNLNIRPGIKVVSLEIDNKLSDFRDTDFGNTIVFRLGVEAELIVPFLKNKWSIFIEPTYQNYTHKKERIVYEDTEFELKEHVTVKYKSIEVPMGIRHYLFINNNSKFFLDAAVLVDYNGNSKIDFESGNDIDISTKTNFAFGAGYKYKDKYSMELKFQTDKQFFRKIDYWTSDYTSLSLIIGYTIF